MSESFDFATPDLFTAGTIGPPGQRVFYLQAREGDALVTLKCEKEQVRVLGEYLGRLLERLSTPAISGGADLALIEPATPAWIVGSIGVGYDETADRVVLVIEEVREQDQAEETEESEQEEEEAPPQAEAQGRRPLTAISPRSRSSRGGTVAARVITGTSPSRGRSCGRTGAHRDSSDGRRSGRSAGPPRRGRGRARRTRRPGRA